MKKLLITILLLISTTLVFADEGDIDKTEIIPDVSKWVLDTDKVSYITKTRKIIYRKVDADNNYISEKHFIFMDREDNPNTQEDETLTDFTSIHNYIQNRVIAGDSIELAIKKACIIKYNQEQE